MKETELDEMNARIEFWERYHRIPDFYQIENMIEFYRGKTNEV